MELCRNKNISLSDFGLCNYLAVYFLLADLGRYEYNKLVPIFLQAVNGDWTPNHTSYVSNNSKLVSLLVAKSIHKMKKSAMLRKFVKLKFAIV